MASFLFFGTAAREPERRIPSGCVKRRRQFSLYRPRLLRWRVPEAVHSVVFRRLRAFRGCCCSSVYARLERRVLQMPLGVNLILVRDR